MSVTTQIEYFAQAKSRFFEQYRRLPFVQAIAQAFANGMDELEQTFFDLKDSRSLYNATGVQLDMLGDLLNAPRAGITDDTQYRLVLFAKVAQNVSQGTAEDVIRVYKLLMQATSVLFVPIQPAQFSITAIGATPIGSTTRIKQAILGTKAAGVGVSFFATVSGTPFAFSGYIGGAGFGTIYDNTVGGTFASIF